MTEASTELGAESGAPSECLAEFLSAIMQRDYGAALEYCQLILQYEPHNATARGFYPLLRHKVNLANGNPTGKPRRCPTKETISRKSPIAVADSDDSESRSGSSDTGSDSEDDVSSTPSFPRDMTVSEASTESGSPGGRSSDGDGSAAASSAFDDNGNAIGSETDDVNENSATTNSGGQLEARARALRDMQALRAQFAARPSPPPPPPGPHLSRRPPPYSNALSSRAD